MLLAYPNAGRGMNSHPTPQVNCPGCIIELLRNNKRFASFKLLQQFDSDRLALSHIYNEEGCLLHFYVAQPLDADSSLYIEFLKLILLKSDKLDVVNAAGETPLAVALRRFNYCAAQMLMRAGALMPAMPIAGKTSLHWLCSNKAYLERLESLYARRQINDPSFELIKKALLPATPVSLKEQVIKKWGTCLLNKKLIPELQAAALYNQLQQTKNFDDRLLTQLPKISLELLKNKILIGSDLGGRVNATDEQGNSPLHVMYPHACPEVAFFLVRAGAHRLAKNSHGLTPADVVSASCKRNCHLEDCPLSRSLREYLAEPEMVLKRVERRLAN